MSIQANIIFSVPGFENYSLSCSHENNEPTLKKRKLENEVSGTPVLILPSGSVPCNSQIRQMIKVVKPYIWQLVEDANLVSVQVHSFSCDTLIIFPVIPRQTVEDVDLIPDPED